MSKISEMSGFIPGLTQEALTENGEFSESKNLVESSERRGIQPISKNYEGTRSDISETPVRKHKLFEKLQVKEPAKSTDHLKRSKKNFEFKIPMNMEYYIEEQFWEQNPKTKQPFGMQTLLGDFNTQQRLSKKESLETSVKNSKGSGLSEKEPQKITNSYRYLILGLVTIGLTALWSNIAST